MPTLEDPRREQFAQLVAAGRASKESYALAGYRGKGASQSANRLNKEPRVSARIAELRLLSQQIPLASSWLNENFVLQGLKDVFQKAMEREKLSDAISALSLMGKRLGLFIERIDAREQYPEDISSLDDKQRTIVMRWLAHLAYPDDPAAAEAALQLPSGSEVIEATAEPKASTPEDHGQKEHELFADRIVEREKMVRSWADLDSEERKHLAAEWSAKGPALPPGQSKEERLAWLNSNWQLE